MTPAPIPSPPRISSRTAAGPTQRSRSPRRKPPRGGGSSRRRSGDWCRGSLRTDDGSTSDGRLRSRRRQVRSTTTRQASKPEPAVAASATRSSSRAAASTGATSASTSSRPVRSPTTTPPASGPTRRSVTTTGTIDKNDGVVESLESGDFAVRRPRDVLHADRHRRAAPTAAGRSSSTTRSGTSRPVSPVSASTTSSSVAINTPDDGNVGNVADNVVTLSNEFTETAGYDQLHGTVTVTNLAPGETAIVRVIVHPRVRARQPDREHPERRSRARRVVARRTSSTRSRSGSRPSR